MKVPRKLVKEILHTLIHVCGDSVWCPSCNFTYSPKGPVQTEAWSLYERLLDKLKEHNDNTREV